MLSGVSEKRHVNQFLSASQTTLSFAKILAGSKIVDRRAVAGHSNRRCVPAFGRSLRFGQRCRRAETSSSSFLALRHQVGILARSDRRFRPADRRFWLCLRWLWPRWREALVLVQPATAERWRREGLRRCWSRRSVRRPGRPRVDTQVRALIRRMASENHLWGAPRIHGELLKLGLAVSERTVSRYLAATRRAPSQTWRTFLANHFGQLTFTSPLMVCDAPHDDDALDLSGALPCSDSVSRDPSSVSSQRSIVHWSLTLQCASVEWADRRGPVQHRRREHPSSGRDPPKARQSNLIQTTSTSIRPESP